ncbi:transferase activity protein [Scheffersomyces xylosifermentans]|uniref:transferase activity protein n=1 Tax=Scheffersomyces xylosifermentans TaxID=1304137 RepID=UPI00315CA481
MTQAVFTLLYNPAYLPGALVLGAAVHKLLDRANDSQTVLGVLIDKSKFSEHQLNLLSRFYSDLVDVNPLQSSLVEKLTNDLGRPELDQTFTKVLLWSLIQYDKILYLDSDTLPIVPNSADKGSVIDLLDLDFPKSKILAAPDSGFPDIFNSGVFVLKPNLHDYSQLDALVKLSATNANVSFDGADQGLLNQYFNSNPDWVQTLVASGASDVTESNYLSNSNWVKIPFLYNVTPSAQYEYLPAFKHFTTTPPPYSAEPNDYEVGGAGEPSEGSEEALQSTRDTLNRYHSAAVTYINYSTTQVKLVHFIGPHKPWKSSTTAAGIHRDWWHTWLDTFGAKSIDEVIHGEHYPAIPSIYRYEEPVVESLPQTEEVSAGPEAPEEPPKPFEPSDLLDPANYQQYEDTIVPSVDALWDPSKEPPPLSEHHNTYSELEQGMKSFQNTWDQPEPEPEYHEEYHEEHHEEHHEEYHEPPAPEPQYEEPPQPPAAFSYHGFVQPERVFDSSSDYFPQHRLQELQKIDITKEQDTAIVNDETSGLNAHAFVDVNEKLSHLGITEDNDGFEDIYDEGVFDEDKAHGDLDEEFSYVDDRSDIPKLFPWEFRQDHRSERVFD